MPSRTDSWSVRGLKERCELLRTDVEAKRLATAEELATYWPGGKNNTAEPGRGQWIFCYAQLVRFRGRSEFREASRAGAEGVALRVLAAEPEVLLTEGLQAFGEGAPKTLAVYPKSAWTMGHIAVLDTVIAHLSAYLEVLRGSAKREDLQLVTAAEGRRADLLALCVWAACHPGPGLPWDTEAPTLPQAPDWVRALDTFTVLRIQQAYTRVNATNLAAMRVLYAPDPDAGDMPARTLFAGLFAGIAVELGFTPDTMIRDRPLLQLLGQMGLRASGVRDARAAGEAKAEREARQRGSRR